MKRLLALPYMKLILLFCAVLAVFVAFSLITGISTCPLYLAAHIPCPACGMTRAWISALHGHFAQAFKYHPLFWLALTAPAPFLFYWRGKIGRNGLNNFWIGFLGLLILVWALRLTAGFPNAPVL